MTTESFRFNFLPHLTIHVRKFQERSIFLKGSTAVCKNYAAQKKKKKNCGAQIQAPNILHWSIFGILLVSC